MEQTLKSDKRKIKPEALESLRATILALFSEDEFHRVGIRDICKRAKVSPQTVYKYYGNKEELLLACIEPDMVELTALAKERSRTAVGLKAKLSALASTQFEFYAERPVIAKLVFMNLPPIFWVNRASVAQAEFQDLYEDVLKEARAAGELPDTLDLTLLQDISSGAASRVILRWLSAGAKDDLRTSGKAYFELLWRLANGN
ncbi:TetR/AcrR family transcriptional regulator [Kordiimonas laminariae]|uniref:TetR/AcrR family transcriptional regulator n=1 Tax=Kordiimonas laminariae TaxID=2917717 RepID=UPI001FF3F598|nr:TetR/AcrR family transcriptional regulator [Kordiimonas laminariae]MCK0068098.1 TetR/AcrR family transcriptional regulator [Kordiimonas laminariae]